MSAAFDLIILLGFSFFLIWFFLKFFLKSFIWILKKTKYILLLFAIGYIAFNFPSFFLWSVAISFIVFLFILLISMLFSIKDNKKLNKRIDEYLKSNDLTGLSNYFVSLELIKKKKFISIYNKKRSIAHKKTRTNGNVLDYLCAIDFCAFAVGHGSAKSAILELETCKKYLSLIWEYESWDEFYKRIKMEINSTSSVWIISEENPKDQSTGKKINLIKIARKDYDLFENSISLD